MKELFVGIINIEEYIKILLVYSLFYSFTGRLKKISVIIVGITIFVSQIISVRFYDNSVNYTLTYIFTFIIPFFLLAGKWYRKIFIFFTICFGFMLLDNFFACIIMIFSGIDIRQIMESEMVSITVSGFEILLLIVLRIIFHYKKINKLSITSQQCFIMMISVTAYMIIIGISQMTLFVEDISDRIKIVCYTLVVFTGCIFIVLCLYQTIVMERVHRLKEKENAYNYFMKMQDYHMKEIIQKNETIRKFKHDISGHLSAIQGICHEENSSDSMKKISKYLESMTDLSGIHEKLVFTGSSSIDAIIVETVNSLDTQTVAFEFYGHADFSQINDDYHLCVIFFNILKNAKEAVEKDSNKNKYIRIAIEETENHIKISEKNTYNGDTIPIGKDKTLITSKQTQDSGYGTQNIIEALKCLNGTIDYKVSPELFELAIILPTCRS